MAVARKYMEGFTQDGLPLLRCWRGAWMRWVTTHWDEIGEAAVRKELYVLLENARYEIRDKDGKKGSAAWRPNRSKLTNVLDALQAIIHTDDRMPAPGWVVQAGPWTTHCGVSSTISCANGLLDVSTRQIQPHSPAFFNVASIPFNYDPSATAPEWEEFLAQLWPGDPDAIKLLQEWMGYLISGRTNLEKIGFIQGPPRSGKGTIGRIIRALLGEHNVVAPTLASIGTQFGLAPLIGKPLALIADARLDSRNLSAVVERLLSISGRDTQTIDRKYKDEWNGELPTRFMIMSNELLAFADASGAIASRFVVLVLTISWYGKEDVRLYDQLAAALPGILNWSLDGLERIGKTDKFTEPESAKDAIQQLHDQASPVSAFLRDCCEFGPAYEETRDAVYRAWRDWCQRNGRDHPGTLAQFGKNLRAARPGIQDARPREDGDRVRKYVGLRVKSDLHNAGSMDQPGPGGCERHRGTGWGPRKGCLDCEVLAGEWS